MKESITFFLQFILFLTNLYAVIYGSIFFSKCFSFFKGVSFFLSSFVIGCGIIVFETTILGITGFLTSPALLSINVVFLLSIKAAKFFLKNEETKIQNESHFEFPSLCFFFLGIFIIPFSYYLGKALFLPPHNMDSITYHLTFVANWIKDERFKIFYFLPYFDLYSYFPLNGELFSLFLMLPFHNDILVNLVNFPFFIAISISIYNIMQRLNADRVWRILPLVVSIFTPCFISITSTSFQEIIFSAFFIIALDFAIGFLFEEKYSYLIISAISSGLLVGIKYTGIFYFLLILLSIILIKWNLKSFFKISFLFIFCAFILSGYWYLRNLLIKGNPIYPIPVEIFGFEIFSGEGEKLEWFKQTSVFSNFSYLLSSGKLFKAIVGDIDPKRPLIEINALGSKAIFFFIFSPILAMISFFKISGKDTKANIIFLFNFFITSLIFIFSPFHGAWIEWNLRFFIPSFLICVLIFFFSAMKMNINKNIVIFLSGLFFIEDIIFSGIKITSEEKKYILIIASLIFLVFLTTLLKKKLYYGFEKEISFYRKVFSYFLLFLILTTGFFFLKKYREEHRYEFYRNASSIQDAPFREFANLWQFLDKNIKEGKVIVAGIVKNQFLYPLFGAELQRKIGYIEVNPREKNASLKYIEELKKEKSDYLLILKSTKERVFPPQREWVKENPSFFTLLYEDDVSEFYKINF